MDLIIDLHLTDPVEDPQNALLHQMEIFEKALDTAIVKNCYEMRVIHGVGSGKLKNEIHKYLKGISFVKSYSNEWSPDYGMGSTLIIFHY